MTNKILIFLTLFLLLTACGPKNDEILSFPLDEDCMKIVPRVVLENFEIVGCDRGLHYSNTSKPLEGYYITSFSYLGVDYFTTVISDFVIIFTLL